MNLAHISNILSLHLTQDIEIKGFSIDSRHIQPGQLFIAIKGDSLDGHDFIHEAVQKGACAIICNRRVDVSVPQLLVEDSLVSLAEIAIAHRKMMNSPVIALTGSNGKTTVKDMIASIFPSPSLATKGNLNNHIGVPLSVLQLEKTHRYAVFELGANHKGEIKYTAGIAEPDVALVTNIGPAHIEGFGSLDDIARAKGEIYQGLAKDATAIVNEDDDYAHFWDDMLVDKQVLRFSMLKQADIHIEQLQFNDQGFGRFILKLPDSLIDIELQVPGEHNVGNAVAAAACCYALGMSGLEIAEGLKKFKGVQGRMSYLAGINKSIIIDDSYNANLRSALTSMKILSERKGKKIFIFGDMGELGQWTEEHHQQIGKAARELGINEVYTFGKYSYLTYQAFAGQGGHYRHHDELAKDVLPRLSEQTTVLVKGSRLSAMEKVVAQLIDGGISAYSPCSG